MCARRMTMCVYVRVYGEEQQKKRVSMMSDQMSMMWDHSPFRTPQIRHAGFSGGGGSAGSGGGGSGGSGGNNAMRMQRPGSGGQGGSARRDGSSSGRKGSSMHSSSLHSPAAAESRRSAGQGPIVSALAGRGWPQSASPATKEQLKMIAKRRLGAMGSGSGF